MISRRRLGMSVAGFAMTALLPACGGTAAKLTEAGKPADAEPTPVAKPAPELDGLQWFNAQPMTLANLRGKAVLLVFWSTI